MPTILRSGPFRFFFYSGDGSEPPHIHVERDNNVAKFWLEPIRLASSGGFGRMELKLIRGIIDKNWEFLMGAWNEYFSH